MRSLTLLVLTFFVIGALADETCKSVTFGNHRMDLARPWPTDYLNDRHTKIQSIVGMYAKALSGCGQLDAGLNFTITAKGEFQLEAPATGQSRQIQCYNHYLSQMQFGVNECGFHIPYKWNGKFPLVNMERKTFPSTPFTNEQ